jgi:hypothetical protein
LTGSGREPAKADLVMGAAMREEGGGGGKWLVG